MLAAQVSCRAREITDALVELLIALVHKINTRAERRVEGELLDDLRRVRARRGSCSLWPRPRSSILMTRCAGRCSRWVGEVTLQDLVREVKANEAAFRERVRTMLRSSYTNHYRRMLPELLAGLEFRCNNMAYRPVMDAVGLLARRAHRDRVKFYDADEQVPPDGVVPAAWRTAVVDERGRVERIPMCCARSPRCATRSAAGRCGSWARADGGGPEADLPGDFELNRDVHHAALRQPTDPNAFLAELRAKLTGALERLDVALTNDTAGGVRITTRRGEPWISVPELVALDEPRVLGDLKAEVARRGGTTHLLDVLKQAAWLCGFTGEFTSVASREVTDRETLRRRLLLVLFALGTNMGVRAIVATGGHGETEAALRRVRRTHVTRDNLRRAVAAVVNETFIRRDRPGGARARRARQTRNGSGRGSRT